MWTALLLGRWYRKKAVGGSLHVVIIPCDIIYDDGWIFMANYDELATRADDIIKDLYNSFKQSVKHLNPLNPEYFAIDRFVLDTLIKEYGNSNVPYVHRSYLMQRINGNWKGLLKKGDEK